MQLRFEKYTSEIACAPSAIQGAATRRSAWLLEACTGNAWAIRHTNFRFDPVNTLQPTYEMALLTCQQLEDDWHATQQWVQLIRQIRHLGYVCLVTLLWCLPLTGLLAILLYLCD